MNLQTYMNQLDFVKISNGIIIVNIYLIEVNFVPVLTYFIDLNH